MATMDLPEALPKSQGLDYLVWLAEEIYFKPNSLISKVLRIEKVSDLSSLVEKINDRHTFIMKRIVYFMEFIFALQKFYYTDKIIDSENYNLFLSISSQQKKSIRKEVEVLLDWRNPSYFTDDPYYEKEIVKAYASILYKMSRIEIEVGEAFEVTWIKQVKEG
ncbi:MAG: hypothetical protein ABIM99_00265 [Candidatus Dojkabacteria bacterium]